MVPLPDENLQTADKWRTKETLPQELVAREAFACVTSKCQIALRLRYYEGYSIREVATELQTSAKYAAKLVSRCLKQAQSRYAKKGEER